MNSQLTTFKGFGGNPLVASSLLFARDNIHTASGLSLTELENGGYDLRKLARHSKTVKQALGYTKFLDQQVRDMQDKGLVIIT